MEDAIGAQSYPLHFSYFQASDGVRLRYFDSQSPGEALLLANGLGGPLVAFGPLIRALSPHFRLISWDYRGLYGSGPLDPRAEIGLPRHALDVVELLDQLELDRSHFLGWSMGVQLALESAARHSHRFDRLVLVNGTAGRPLATLPLPGAEALPALFPWLGRGGPLYRLALGSLGPKVRALQFGKSLGLVAPSFSEEHFEAMRGAFATLDFRLYFRLLDELCAHSAAHHLSAIEHPTLVISGGRDRLTPKGAGRDLANRLLRGTYKELPEATHYAAAEFPEEIARLVVRFTDK